MPKVRSCLKMPREKTYIIDFDGFVEVSESEFVTDQEFGNWLEEKLEEKITGSWGLTVEKQLDNDEQQDFRYDSYVLTRRAEGILFNDKNYAKLSESQKQNVIEWFKSTLIKLNKKVYGSDFI